MPTYLWNLVYDTQGYLYEDTSDPLTHDRVNVFVLDTGLGVDYAAQMNHMESTIQNLEFIILTYNYRNCGTTLKVL